MRKLSKKQIKVLEDYTVFDSPLGFEELPMKAKQELIRLNDYETLIQDVDRWLFDRIMEGWNG